MCRSVTGGEWCIVSLGYWLICHLKKLCAGPTFLVTAPPLIVGVPPASLIHRAIVQAAARRIQGSIDALARESVSMGAGIN
jgi:hypothetical protein